MKKNSVIRIISFVGGFLLGYFSIIMSGGSPIDWKLAILVGLIAGCLAALFVNLFWNLVILFWR
jgi:hypothetical protein